MRELPDYVASTIKLSGKKLDKELKYRKTVKENRITQRKGFRQIAKELGIKPTEVLAYEYGYDCCGHSKTKKNILGFPLPKAIYEHCVKCGMPIEGSLEKVNDENIKETYRIFKKIMGKSKQGKKIQKSKGEVRNDRARRETGSL